MRQQVHLHNRLLYGHRADFKAFGLGDSNLLLRLGDRRVAERFLRDMDLLFKPRAVFADLALDHVQRRIQRAGDVLIRLLRAENRTAPINGDLYALADLFAVQRDGRLGFGREELIKLLQLFLHALLHVVGQRKFPCDKSDLHGLPVPFRINSGAHRSTG